MNSNKNNNISIIGVGFADLLFFIFLILKLCHVIDWSWWWVIAPIWIYIALIVLIFVIIFMVFFIKRIAERIKKRR